MTSRPSTWCSANALRYSRCRSGFCSALPMNSAYPASSAASSMAFASSEKNELAMSGRTTPSTLVDEVRRARATRFGR